ncbi:MAG TPA: DUF4397 domain-containing protein [Gemmatimonadales bacterium]|nr:DUF4397 domain-containing protein [Gemmatimonadales bacterium]
MTRLRFSLCCAVVATVACSKDATFTEPIPPQAAVHWMEAVPDTMSMDLRPIDIVTNAGLFDQVFRGSNMFYQGIEAGTRHLRIFLSGPNPVNASTIVLDTTVSFTSASSYTVIHAGFARTGSAPRHTLWVVPDAATDPGAGNIGLRVLNAGAGMGNVDIRFKRHAADTLLDTPNIANLGYQGIGNYFTVPRDSAGADSLRIVVTATGTKSPVLFAAATGGLKLPAGLAGTITSNPIAGSRVAGSVITAVIVPPSVVGSLAPQGGAFAAPSAVFLVDKRPPNTIPQ